MLTEMGKTDLSTVGEKNRFCQIVPVILCSSFIYYIWRFYSVLMQLYIFQWNMKQTVK